MYTNTILIFFDYLNLDINLFYDFLTAKVNYPSPDLAIPHNSWGRCVIPYINLLFTEGWSESNKILTIKPGVAWR